MRIAIAAATAATLMMSTVPAQAFCGFFVNGSNKKMFADASQVVLMRSGTRTVLSMKNDYRGPLEDFAMVIPVPVVLKDTDVRVLSKVVFDRIDSLGAPRLRPHAPRARPARHPVPFLSLQHRSHGSQPAPFLRLHDVGVQAAA